MQAFVIARERRTTCNVFYWLFQHGLFTTMHKYYTLDEWKAFAVQNPDCLKNMAASSGTGNEDFERLSGVLAAVPELAFICIDVANGYSQHFVEYVRKVRAEFPKHTIIVSVLSIGYFIACSSRGFLTFGLLPSECYWFARFWCLKWIREKC